ncbi:MAG: DNA methyltransferase [Aphanizomenon sp.]
MVNQLYYGDNLEVLRRYIKDESVDLCYIDPPFNSKRNYNQIYNNIGAEDKAQAQAFIDTWEWDDHAIRGINEILINYHGLFTQQCIALITGLSNVLGKGSLLAYLVSMTLRITEIHRVLKPTGSFYLHCDPTASHYLKLILDAIFCSQGGDFRNEIIWGYIAPSAAKKDFPRKHDVIFRYTKSNIFIFNSENIRIPYSEEFIKRRKYSEGKSGIYAEKSTGRNESDLKEFSKGKIPPSWWTDIKSGGQIPRKELLGYPTQKPESLLERIIKASSNQNDIVLDAYCGCGTTVAVCQKLDRQWIGIDITYQSISLILKRLEDSFPGVLKTIKLHGIPKDIESAKALANKTDDRTRKEFEKWAILTYTNNKAVINAKKGADKGIDGIVYFQGDKNDPEKIIFQVKSGKVKSGDIRDLLGTMTLESASLAIFITLEEPTKDMLKTAKSAGFYQSKYMSHSCDKIQIVTIKEIIEDQQRLNIRLSYEVLKSAEKQKEVRVNQIELDI